MVVSSREHISLKKKRGDNLMNHSLVIDLYFLSSSPYHLIKDHFGSDFDVLLALEEHLNFKHELINPPGFSYGYAQENGSWSGIPWMLNTDQADFTIGAYSLNWQLYQAISMFIQVHSSFKATLYRIYLTWIRLSTPSSSSPKVTWPSYLLHPNLVRSC